MIDVPLPEGSNCFSGVWTAPPNVRFEVCYLSIARFPVLARPRVEVNVEPTKMANRGPEPLGDFVRRIRNEKGLSCEDVSRESARFGKPITASYVNRIENESTRKPSANRLKALALGLGVPAEELLVRAAGLVTDGAKSNELHLLTRFRELTPERQADVLSVVDMFHSQAASRRSPRRRLA